MWPTACLESDAGFERRRIDEDELVSGAEDDCETRTVARLAALEEPGEPVIDGKITAVPLVPRRRPFVQHLVQRGPRLERPVHIRDRLAHDLGQP